MIFIGFYGFIKSHTKSSSIIQTNRKKTLYFVYAHSVDKSENA